LSTKERTMENQVSWLIELAVKPGELETFKALREEMVAGTSGEPGALAYEWFISDDGGTVHIYEKYADSDAMISHVNGFREKWAGRFRVCVDVQRFTSYGSPTAAAEEVLDGFGGTHLGPWGGFSR
jgi:quinol monooxygenase YgiN